MMFHLSAQNPDATMSLGQLTRMVYLVVRALCVEQDTEVQVHFCLICYLHLQQLLSVLPSFAGHLVVCLMDYSWFPTSAAYVSIHAMQIN